MALPDNITTIDVRLKYVDINGNQAAGNVTFTPSTSLVDPTRGVIVVASTTVVTLTNGTALVTLPVTDDTDANPIGFTYAVQENIPGGRSYSIALPSTLGTSVNLSQCTPVIPSAGLNPYATNAQYTALDARVTTLDNTATTLATYTASASTAAAAATTANAAATLASQTVSATTIHPFTLMGI